MGAGRNASRLALVVVVAVSLAALGAIALDTFVDAPGPLPPFEAQACALEDDWLELTQRGYYEPRSGQIALLPKTPAYMATGGPGWSHSGPWRYLQHVPLVFYGPGIVPEGRTVTRPVTLADVAPTTAALMKGVVSSPDGAVLPEVARLGAELLRRQSPRLIVTIVWDGAGWNALEMDGVETPNLDRMVASGVSFIDAGVGSSPSVAPAVHTTIGTGVFPHIHGVTGVPVRDERGRVVDSFLQGESSRFIQKETIAELWDRQNDNRALVGMVGYEPWDLGMIGRGAERPGGDRDHAVWLNTKTNAWTTNPRHYSKPAVFDDQSDLTASFGDYDAADALENDGRWFGIPLVRPGRKEETGAFIAHHARKLIELIDGEGYGRDATTDLLFTNFVQIDRVGHYFNMDSVQVRRAIEETDAALGAIFDALDELVGEKRYVTILTADHGQQPDEAAVDGVGIDPNELDRDLAFEFGPVVHAVSPTEALVDERALAERDLSVDEIARFIGDYRLRDNVTGIREELFGVGGFSPADRLFEMAIPSRLLPELTC